MDTWVHDSVPCFGVGGRERLWVQTFFFHVRACVCAKSLQSCPTFFNPTDCSLPGSSVYGILWARILDWAATPSSGDLPHPGIETACLASLALAGGFFTSSATWDALFHVQLCLKRYLLVLEHLLLIILIGLLNHFPLYK